MTTLIVGPMADPASIPGKLDSALTLGWQWLDSHSAQILIGCVAGAILIALLYGLKRTGQWLARKPDQWRGVIGRALASMRVWFMVATAAEIVTSSANAPHQFATPVHLLFVIAAGLQAALFMRELFIATVEIRADLADPSGSLGNAMGLIRFSISAGVFIVAIILILSNIGVNVTGLLAGLGIGGIAIGLAAQGIFSDLFAALAILFDKPFRRGDTITWEGNTGTVEWIGLKSTRVRAQTGEEIIVSNTNLLSKVLRNQTQIEDRKVIQLIPLSADAPPTAIAELPAQLEAAINAVEGCHYLRSGLEAISAAGLDFRLIYAISAGTAEEVLTRRHEANHAVLTALHRAGVAPAAAAATVSAPAPTPA